MSSEETEETKDLSERTTPVRSDAAHRHGDAESLRRYCLDEPLFAERYEGWDELGRGGYGTVIRTRLRSSGDTVAVKLMSRFADSDHWRFRIEAQALERIVHPSVVRTRAAFSYGPLSWIEMEYVEGVTLGRELRRRRETHEPWPLTEALEIARSAAKGLTAVHAAGVIHRDIKPDNILLPASGQPAAKVADFGIARVLDASSYTRTGWIPGTPRYGAPELLNGEPVGPEADVYGLSVTLYQLFADGTDPYALAPDASVSEIVYAHTRKAPIPLGSLAPDVPEAVADVIRRGLDKTPKNRPSAQDVARVMSAALAGLRGEVHESEARVVRPRPRAGARVAVAVAAGVSMLMLLGVMTVWRHWRGATQEKDGARVAATTPSRKPSLAVVTPPDHRRLRVLRTAPGVVGVYNESGLDFVEVIVHVGAETYPVGAVARDETAWIFTTNDGAMRTEARTRDGVHVIGAAS